MRRPPLTPASSTIIIINFIKCVNNNKGNSYYSIYSLSFLDEDTNKADMALSYHKQFPEGKSGPISSRGLEVGKEARKMDKEQG